MTACLLQAVLVVVVLGVALAAASDPYGTPSVPNPGYKVVFIFMVLGT